MQDIGHCLATIRDLRRRKRAASLGVVNAPPLAARANRLPGCKCRALLCCEEGTLRGSLRAGRRKIMCILQRSDRQVKCGRPLILFGGNIACFKGGEKNAEPSAHDCFVS